MRKLYGPKRVSPGGVPASEELARRVVSLPMHPYLDETTQDRIVDDVRRALDGEQ